MRKTLAFSVICNLAVSVAFIWAYRFIGVRVASAPPQYAESPSIFSGPLPWALIYTAIIFAIDLGVLWVLLKLGGEALKTQVKATIKRFGGSIIITSAGMVGTFFALVICTVAIVYFVGFMIPAHK